MALSFYRVLFRLALSIVRIVVGSTYSDCYLGILLWLRISGGVEIGVSILSILVNCCRPSKDADQEDNCSFFLNVTRGAIVLSMSIWGSVITFSIYSYWQYWDKDHYGYCNYTLYMSIFVGLIIYWTILALYVIYRLCSRLPRIGYQEI